MNLTLPKVTCPCGKSFVPKSKGYNALYCSNSCKCKANNKKRTYSPEKRKSEHEKVKQDPDKLEKYRASGRKAGRNSRKWLSAYKLEHGCCDCGYKGHSAALQLDHTGEKSAEIANLRSSVPRLKEEIEKGKCVVRCANCHSVKTWAEKNGLPYIPEMATWGIS